MIRNGAYEAYSERTDTECCVYENPDAKVYNQFFILLCCSYAYKIYYCQEAIVYRDELFGLYVPTAVSRICNACIVNRIVDCYYVHVHYYYYIGREVG